MKANFLKSILGAALTAVLFTGCVNDDDYSIPELVCNDPGLVANKQVSDIYTQATALPVLYAADDIIEARVVSSDKGGNFFKIMYLTSLDGTRGFSLAINATDLYNQYNVGRKVYIKLKGLYTQIRNNTLQIGALYEGAVGQIAQADYKASLISSCNTVDEETLVQEITLAQISDAQIGKLVELTNVQFADEALGQTYFNPTGVLVGGQTNHNITDATGATLIFRTGSFAEYRALPVESKSGRIRGILTKFGATYQFIARYTTDIRLTETRIGGEPETPEEPENPGTTPPELPGTLLFAGGNFNNYPAFIASVNSFGLKPYATESPANGLGGTTALRINGTPTANDYVFTVKAPAGLPTNATKITFWIKGTATGKALSFNVNRSTSGYDVFNLSSLSAPVTLTKNTEINTSGNGTNQYTGSINTNNTWIKVTLDLTGVLYNTTAGNDIFSLKTGNGGVYDLYIDNFIIE